MRTSFRPAHALLILACTCAPHVKIQKAIETKLYSCGISLNLSKAFETVNHDILLKKLENCGIRGIAKQWFCSYLSNRKQFVCFGSIKSEERLVTCVVPQGSFLGPLLFLLYIYDFSNSATNNDFYLFADDSNLFCSHKNLQSLEQNLNMQLRKFNQCLCANKLSLNIDKSNFVIFRPPQKKIEYTVKLQINNKIIEERKCIKYLGIFIDCHLNWKEHVHELSKEIARGIGILSKLRPFVSQAILVQVYYSIIYSFLVYGVLIWGNTYKTNIQPLVILQKKKALRIITFSDFKAHSSPLFKNLNLLKLPDIIKLYTASFMHQYNKGTLPKNFNNFFTSVRSKHQYSTRLASKSTFSLPSARTNYGIFSIRFQGPKVWNNIDESLKSLSYSYFKLKVK